MNLCPTTVQKHTTRNTTAAVTGGGQVVIERSGKCREFFDCMILCQNVQVKRKEKKEWEQRKREKVKERQKEKMK